MSVKNTLKALLIIIISSAIGAAGGYYAYHKTSQRKIIQFLQAQQFNNNKLSTTLGLIDMYYLDSIPQDTLIEEVMPLLMDRLDPHSSYIPATDMKAVNESLDGEFEGIGVVFNMSTDTVIILNVITQGPSDKVGILARDRIIMIDDSLVAGQKIRQTDIVKMLKGPRETVVKLGVERDGADELIEFKVTRDKISVNSITAALMLNQSTGYIKIEQFARTTHEELLAASKKLQKEGMKSMILDLRGNPGGYLDQAIMLSNEFLPKGELIVYTQDKAGNQEKIYSQYDGSLQDVELVVLIDESSASSSEILAGALQDNDHGTIIGRRSFGKGLIQKQIPFRDGSALRLTTAEYLTPTGRSIQKPFERGDNEAYERDLLNRYEHNELYTADSIIFVDSLSKVTPKGKIVYGGGGIMPDIFVPIPTDTLPQFFASVVSRNILYMYTIKYSDVHRAKLATVENLQDLQALFDADTRLFEDFVLHAKREGVISTPEDIEASRELVTRQLRGYIGRGTKVEDSGFYINIYPLDDAIMKALDHLGSR